MMNGPKIHELNEGNAAQQHQGDCSLIALYSKNETVHQLVQSAVNVSKL